MVVVVVVVVVVGGNRMGEEEEKTKGNKYENVATMAKAIIMVMAPMTMALTKRFNNLVYIVM